MICNQADYDTWFRAKVQEALEDMQPARPHDEVKSHFAKRRAPQSQGAGSVKFEWALFAVTE